MRKLKQPKYKKGERLVVIDDGFQNGSRDHLQHYFPFGTEVTVDLPPGDPDNPYDQKERVYRIVVDKKIKSARHPGHQFDVLHQWVEETALGPLWEPVTDKELKAVMKSLTGK